MGRAVLAVSAWHDGHLSLTVEGSALVLEVRGNRR